MENEIILGDAYELIKTLPDKSVDLIVTDPPYQIEGMHGGTGIFKWRKISYHKQLMEDDHRIVSGINMEILEQFVRVMKRINIYLWCNKEQIYDYLTFFVKERGCNWEMLIWAKDDPTPFCSTHYLKDKEYCLYFWEAGVRLKPTFNTAKTVYVTHKNMTDKKKYAHPTIKPEEIIENLIRNSSGGGAYIRPVLRKRDDLRGREEIGASLPGLRDKPEVARGCRGQAQRHHEEGKG